ncbi:hypothetical protein GUJ93_ZPchr0010g8329 [Zizania palustris]|uniref:Secreted protein n=1 Tax=Zizania palustris TaxID=103762 RepID=A0A8J5W810_ZIZPA|nr:hypothetical protein GUJ93_ZPchr0010g8329 [Zizania palustris]
MVGLGCPYLLIALGLSNLIPTLAGSTRSAPMALLAVQALAACPATFPSHHHGAVSSYAALPAAAFSRSRARLAAGAALSAPLTPVLESNMLCLLHLSVFLQKGFMWLNSVVKFKSFN